jgi:5-methylcytosine-specific restriction enzyme subunit McrC
MRYVCVRERGVLRVGGGSGELPRELFERLRLFDERFEATHGKRLFDWRRERAFAGKYVGVFGIPGVTVEILPRVDGDRGDGGDEARCRSNLLAMMAIAGHLELDELEVADLANRQAPLSRILIELYARRLRAQLGRGLDRSYKRRREESGVLRGRLDLPRHIRRNITRRDRFCVQRDVHTHDTWLNRVFLATCTRLMRVPHAPGTRQVLAECVGLLDGVACVEIKAHHFDGLVHLTRQTRRFSTLLSLSRLFLLGNSSPIQAAGSDEAYAFVFDMERLYEDFIAAFLRRHVLTRPSLGHLELITQGRGQHTSLLSERSPSGELIAHLPMRPDVLLRPRGDEPGERIVIDTKWKTLRPEDGRRQQVKRGDLYQMYAYSYRFDAPRCVLLYPHVPGARGQDLDIREGPGGMSGRVVQIRTVDVGVALCSRQGREAMADELQEKLGLALERR